ncbi:hypothetical protein PTNB73_08088 [Pyrenophora teres f. teres]|nr:hypothetical protein PTNB85_06601 [Pyrenophora teres f. teres]KAE8837182.1 hypothetical protein HRS9122_07337 [Pyrenophora teres f. teres]KAE8855871.1 hypothetical protein PTNB29_08710 [Pyrenophora teres f. teres]KAE8860478.1 hypothetical protein PTNB73_08088 [Pyrenophora teres f. teres]
MVVTAVITENSKYLQLKVEKPTLDLPHAEISTGRVVPIKHPEGSKADFEQSEMLKPQQQYLLTANFDPEETTGGFAHGHDPFLTHHDGVDFMGFRSAPIPVQPQVHILGRGPVPEGHFGFPPDFELQGIDHGEFHLPPYIPAVEREAGASRFYQWHFDGSLYDISPPRLGYLLAVRTPKGPDATVRWEDEAGTQMKMAPGSMAMIAGSRALELLDEETKNIVMNSRIEYAPHTFVWMSKTHRTRLGHSIETEGLERPLDELPKRAKSKVCIYPMEGAETVVKDLKEVRAFMDKLMRPAIQPENIYAHPHKEQDVILWYNRALWHSITEFPKSYGPCVMNQ